MELLEFSKKILSLCNVDSIQDISSVLLKVSLENDTSFFDNYNNTVDNSKDWLQALWQYYEADRTEKKQDYTPKSLCELVAMLGGEADSIYDCCGGSGALTKAYMRNHNVKNIYVEELDENAIPFLLFNLCLSNANGYVVNCDVLTREKKKAYKLSKGEKYSYCEEITDFSKLEKAEQTLCDVAISNPPYNIKWQPPTLLEMDERFPVIPPQSSANYAFIFNCIARAKSKAILILPNGVFSERTEMECRRYLVENDLIETVIVMPDKMFEMTSISTCMIVLNKNKRHKGEILFIDCRKNYIVEEREQNGQFGGASHTNRTYKKAYNVLSAENMQRVFDVIESREKIAEFSTVKTKKDIAENDYLLIPSRYIEFEEREQKHRIFQEIADNINYISRMQNSCKLVINETLAKRYGFDIDLYKQSKENSKQTKEQMKALGIDIEVEDYIQFTKNKNEFVFKCNDKEILPDIMSQFLTIWKTQIALLNTMQNQYLAELRDALLPDLMSGKISL